MEIVLTEEQIARVCHEANRAYCMNIGDHSQPPWEMAPVWQKESAILGVREALSNPDRTPEDSHKAWMELKKSQGWKYGPHKAPEKLEHPCMLPYSELPQPQKVKDKLFLSVVRALQAYTMDRPKPVSAVSEPPKDGGTQETGILTEDGEIVKDGEVETTVRSKDEDEL
jgi:hypothetical protein